MRWIDYSNGWLGGFTVGLAFALSGFFIRDGFLALGVVGGLTAIGAIGIALFVTRPMLLARDRQGGA